MNANVAWEDRIHFFAVSARLLRRILVDHARAHHRQKRGGGVEMISLDEAVMIGPDKAGEIVVWMRPWAAPCRARPAQE